MTTKLPSASPVLIELIERERYGVEYQPIVDVKSQDIYAFEALARFYDRNQRSLPPQQVYAALHQSPQYLFRVEYQQKVLQLARAPQGANLFVNLDQDSYFSCGISCQVGGVENPFLDLFDSHRQGNIVVELIENSAISHAMMSLAMIEALSRHHFRTAIDDVCDPESMISTSVIQLVDYIKLDRRVAKEKHNQNLLHLAIALVGYARTTKKQIILEGVETDEDLRFAQAIGVDYVQGYLYRDRFINIV